MKASLMLPHSGSGPSAAIRRIGIMPWNHDGFEQLSIWARGEVPRFDDPILRGALGRCARLCESLGALDRALNREPWPLGYVALIEAAAAEESIAHVVIAGSR
jgi:hypothetical protein